MKIQACTVCSGAQADHTDAVATHGDSVAVRTLDACLEARIATILRSRRWTMPPTAPGKRRRSVDALGSESPGEGNVHMFRDGILRIRKSPAAHQFIRNMLFLAIASGLGCALAVEGVRWLRDPARYQPRDGDVILQADVSGRALVIQAATFCVFNHVGIVVQDGNRFYVHEATRTVSRIPLGQFLRRTGTRGRIAVLRHPAVTSEIAQKVTRELQRQGRKPYDSGLAWSDDEFYCSELVWKAFERGAGIQIARPVPLRSRYWARLVASFVPMRYRVDRRNFDDPSVMPADLLRGSCMKVVFRNI